MNIEETSNIVDEGVRSGVVTGTRSCTSVKPEMLAFTSEAGLTYVPRSDRGIERIMKDENVSLVAVWENDGPILYHDGDRFFYHPGMGKNRITRLRHGEADPLLKATDVKPGSTVLDCTLGLGSDALLISYAVGPSGTVVGVESSQIIAAVVRWGMNKYSKGPVWLKEAMERIRVLCADHLSFLYTTPDDSFDVVYFDPMFRHPITVSSGISPMRALANHQPLSETAIVEARRIARRRVVMKERTGSSEFSRLGFNHILSGNKSDISYGIIEVENQGQWFGLSELKRYR